MMEPFRLRRRGHDRFGWYITDARPGDYPDYDRRGRPQRLRGPYPSKSAAKRARWTPPHAFDEHGTTRRMPGFENAVPGRNGFLDDPHKSWQPRTNKPDLFPRARCWLVDRFNRRR